MHSLIFIICIAIRNGPCLCDSQNWFCHWGEASIEGGRGVRRQDQMTTIHCNKQMYKELDDLAIAEESNALTVFMADINDNIHDSSII